MRNLLLLLCFTTFISCKAQEKLKLSYVSHNYSETMNKSFLNNELKFFKDKDTIRINIKVPYDNNKNEIIDRGIFYNCQLREGTIYTIELKKVCVNDIPESVNSYYRINAIFDKTNCSKFVEVENNTPYEYKGNYGMYVDIGNILYKVIRLSPSDTCVFQH